MRRPSTRIPLPDGPTLRTRGFRIRDCEELDGWCDLATLLVADDATETDLNAAIEKLFPQ